MSDYLNLFSRLRKDYKSIDLDQKCDKNGSLQNVPTKCHNKLSLQNSVPVTVVTDVYESHTSPFFLPNLFYTLFGCRVWKALFNLSHNTVDGRLYVDPHRYLFQISPAFIK